VVGCQQKFALEPLCYPVHATSVLPQATINPFISPKPTHVEHVLHTGEMLDY